MSKPGHFSELSRSAFIRLSGPSCPLGQETPATGWLAQRVNRHKIQELPLLDFSGDTIFAEFEMSDDPDDKQPKAEDALPPFVQNDDSSHLIAAAAHARRQRWRMNPALYMNNNPMFPPLLDNNRGKTVHYVDFGFTSAREYWEEVVLPAYECFRADPIRGKAIIASFPAWHMQDWIWHEQHPGEDTRNNKNYESFQAKLLDECPELTWIRDVADAGKHRGLGRQKPKVEVREVRSPWPLNATPLTITLTDEAEHNFADVLARVIEYWRATHFS
jgi:hypothetical protein